MKKLCIDCNKNFSVERKRCKDCVIIYNRERAKKYIKKDRIRYGIVACDVCGNDLIKNRPNQTTHGKCRIRKKTVDDYNSVSRSKTGKTVARQMVLNLGFKIGKNIIIHHYDENPENNVLNNFWIIGRKDHAKLHHFYDKMWSQFKKLNCSDSENCWNSFRDQLTTTWLETTGVNVLKITDISRSAAEPLNENCIYIFSIGEGSETMYRIPETDNAVGKDIVQTQNTNVCFGNKVG